MRATLNPKLVHEHFFFWYCKIMEAFGLHLYSILVLHEEVDMVGSNIKWHSSFKNEALYMSIQQIHNFSAAVFWVKTRMHRHSP